MSATRLRLPASADIPRELLIQWEYYGAEKKWFHANCHAFLVVGGCSQSVAYGGAHGPAEARLRYEQGHNPVLWLTCAQFDLTNAEAAEVERVFESLGLKVEREEPQP